MSIPVKVSFDKQYRRFQLDSQFASLAQFKQRCYTSFKISHDTITFIMYKDSEGDWVTVEQEDEWLEAKRQLSFRSDVTLSLRVKIVPQNYCSSNVIHDLEELVKEAIRTGERQLHQTNIRSILEEVIDEIKNSDSTTRKQVGSAIKQVCETFEKLFEKKEKKMVVQEELDCEQQPKQQQQQLPDEPIRNESHMVWDLFDNTNNEVEAEEEEDVEENEELNQLFDKTMVQHEEEEQQLSPNKELLESWTFLEIQQSARDSDPDSDSNSDSYSSSDSDTDSEIDESDITVEEEEKCLMDDDEENNDATEEDYEDDNEDEPFNELPSCLCVEHLSVPDGSKITPGTTITKTWKLQNNGMEQWSEVMLAYYEGPRPEVINLKFITSIPDVKPGETTDVSVQITSPIQQGVYHGNFRLATQFGECFGDSFGFNFEIVTPEAPIPPKWKPKFELLESMGFTDRREELAQMLQKYKGNVRVVALHLIDEA